MGEIHWKTEQARRRTFWPINTADKIWRPRAKAWFLKLPCLTWPVVKIIVSRIKTSRNWRGIPHFHTPSFYINIDQLLKISKKRFAFALARLDDLIASVTAIEETRLRAKKTTHLARPWRLPLTAAILVRAQRRHRKGSGPSNAWIMSTGWLPTIRGFLAQWRPILELQQQKLLKSTGFNMIIHTKNNIQIIIS